MTRMDARPVKRPAAASNGGHGSNKRARGAQPPTSPQLSLSAINLTTSDETDSDEPASELSDDSHHSSSSGNSSSSSSGSSGTNGLSSLPPLPRPPTQLVASPRVTQLEAAAAAARMPYDFDAVKPSPFPIFRERNIVDRSTPPEDKTEAELQQLTFDQYLDYYLVHSSFEAERRYMFSDERYCLLLGYLTGTFKRITDYAREKELDKAELDWLQRKLGDNTYKYMVAEYSGRSVSDIDKGPVLLCFKEPRQASGAKDCRRNSRSTTPLTEGLARRCVPYSQISQVLMYVHAGHLGRSNHIGQKTCWERFSLLYDGVSRELVRTFVKKCTTCQQTTTRVHKAPLVHITAKTLFERVVIELIDFERKPSCGYRYIFHAVDHFSKFHWAWAMKEKTAANVAFFLATLLADIGPVQYVQCDQGREFIAEVHTVLEQFGCKPVNSAPYHPQTNGLDERGNGMLKTALAHWFIQQNTEEWYPPLARIRYQINCNKPRTTKFTPYELVYSKRPPAWQGPLSSDTLEAVMKTGETTTEAAAATAAATAAAAVAAAPQSDTAATILSTMATSAAPPLPAAANPQPALPSSQLPLRQPPPPGEDLYDNKEFVLNSWVGQPGPLNKYMADHLNVGCELFRLGGEGSGRCGSSAMMNAIAPMDYIHLTSDQRRNAYDKIRRGLHALWLQLSKDKQLATKQRRLQKMVFELGNSGSSADDPQTRPATPEAAWAQLGEDLSVPTKSLGWDALALMATEHKVNMLLFCCLEQVHDYGPGTTQATQYWATASDADKAAQMARSGRKKPGGGWVHTEGGTTQVLVTPFVVQDRPWVVLYQRNLMEWTLRKQGENVTTETSGGGHYEAVVKGWTEAGTGEQRYVGSFKQGGDTDAEWSQVQTLANRLQAERNSERASLDMAADHDNKHKPKVYRMLDAVGVRIPGSNPRKGDTANCLPGLVIGVTRRAVGTGKTAVHQLYTVWTPQGVLTAKQSVDKLHSLTINSFPALLAFRDVTLTAAERLPPDDPGYQEPLLGTAAQCPKVTLTNAWTAHRATFEQRTVDMSRQRSVPARATANAADTAIQAARADRRKGYTLDSISNQPASQPSHNGRASYIVRIVRESKTHYTVEWSEPQGAPATSREAIGWLNRQHAYITVVEAWRKQHPQVQQQEQQQEQQEDTQMDTDPSAEELVEEAEDSDDGEVEYMTD